MSLKIRSATVNDAQAIHILIASLAAYFVEPGSQGEQDFLKTIAPEAIAGYVIDPAFIYLIGEVDGELAGVIALKERVHVYHMFVAVKFQRQGIAQELWEKIKNMAQAQGNPGWFTLNATPYAVPVYERFGFKATGVQVDKYGLSFVPMRLELTAEH